MKAKKEHAGPTSVIRSGQGPQFASTAGTGSQTAISNSGPGAQQTSIGQNTFPSPDIFGAGHLLNLLSPIEGMRTVSCTQACCKQTENADDPLSRATLDNLGLLGICRGARKQLQ